MCRCLIPVFSAIRSISHCGNCCFSIAFVSTRERQVDGNRANFGMGHGLVHSHRVNSNRNQWQKRSKPTVRPTRSGRQICRSKSHRCPKIPTHCRFRSIVPRTIGRRGSRGASGLPNDHAVEPMTEKRAADRIRTDDNHVGNVMLYQLSYSREEGKL